MKSYSTAIVLSTRGHFETLKILCAREIQESLKDSVYDLLQDTIERMQYQGWLFKNEEIINKENGTRFIFKGLKDLRATRALKSYYNIDICWVEEAEAVSSESWDMLTPTIRKDGSEIWATFNRYDEFDPVYKKYCLRKKKNTFFCEVNWRDNPWFPKVLEDERQDDWNDALITNDFDLYNHKWENHPIASFEKSVIPQNIVMEAARRQVETQSGARQVIGVDVAREGNDKTKVYERRGNIVRKLFERKHESPVVTALEVAALCDNKATQINCDNGGLGGGGLNDTLRQKGYFNVVDINFNGSPKNKKLYKNIATEMYFEAKEKLKFVHIPDILELHQDLYGRRFRYTNEEIVRREIERKEIFKERYRRSPDDGDACLLCLYEPGGFSYNADVADAMKERRENQRTKRSGQFIG